MTYTEYDYDSIAHLPEYAQCFIRNSYSGKKEKAKSYLDGAVKKIPTIVNVEILLTTDEEASAFHDFYDIDLNGGTEAFTLYGEVFGSQAYYVMSIIDGIEEIIVGGDTRKIKFSAEVIGISYPDYSPSHNYIVTTEGKIQATLQPSGADAVYDPLNFTITLNDETYSALSAERIDDILHIAPEHPITSYPSVMLTHTEQEGGLVTFGELALINNSIIERASPSGSAFTSATGEEIYIYLDRITYAQSWDNATLPFTILADGEDILLSAATNCQTTSGEYGIIRVFINSSRPIYEYEEVTVSFNITDNIEVAPFSSLSITNNSSTAGIEDNEIITASIESGGFMTIANMTAPQDRIYNKDNFSLVLDDVSYEVSSVVQDGGILTVEHCIGVTTYITTARLIHSTIEYGFDVVDYTLSNNTALLRASPYMATTTTVGEHISVSLNRDIYKGYDWSASSFSVTADDNPILLDDTGEYPYISAGDNIIHIKISSDNIIASGEVILVSYTETDNVEISSFTNQHVTNNSLLPTSNKILSASIDTTGLIITCTMSNSLDHTHQSGYFEIFDEGYTYYPLQYSAISAVQVGTTLTVTLDSGNVIRSATSALLNYTRDLDNYLQKISDLSITNNSTVVKPEFLSANVVSSGNYIEITMTENLEAHEWGMTEFVVEVEGTGRAVITAPSCVENSPTIIIYTEGTIYIGDVVTVSSETTDDPQVLPFTDESVTNSSTKTSPSSQTPYIYLMTEPLKEWGGYYWLVNSSSSGSEYDGKLCHSDGSSWTLAETQARYTQNKTIDLTGGMYPDTGMIVSSGEVSHAGAYDVDMNNTYKMYELVDYGDGTSDVWYGDNDTALTLTSANTGLNYTPPTTSYKPTEYPKLPIIPTVSISTIDDITDLLAHTITLTFNTEVDSFTIADITQTTPANGTIDNLVQDADNLRVWTFDYTANSGINDASNAITIEGAGGEYSDAWSNNSTADIVSNTFAINEEASLGAELIQDPNFDGGSEWSMESGISISGGKLVFATSSNQVAWQEITVENGETYKLVHAIEDFVSGEVTCRLDPMAEGYTYNGANNTYEQDVTPTSDTITVKIQGRWSGGCTLKIDNTSLKKYL